MSPTVWREGGFAFVVNTAEHAPPHVHVLKGCTEVKILIGEMGQKPAIIKARGMGVHEVGRALRIVGKLQTELLARWREIHG